MMAVDFQESNITLGKPSDMTDEQCSSIRAQKTVTHDGFPCFLTCWMPSKEDLEALNAGRPLILMTLGEGFPPVSLFTNNEKLEPNV
jgi:hypothetical protein